MLKLNHSSIVAAPVPHPGVHPYAESIENLTVGIFPIDPTWSPGETYAFIVNVNGQTGYAVDAEDAISLARMMFDTNADELSTRPMIDLGGPDGGRFWWVVSDHTADDPDARSAAVYARCTGSVGGTYNEARVERVTA